MSAKRYTSKNDSVTRENMSFPFTLFLPDAQFPIVQRNFQVFSQVQVWQFYFWKQHKQPNKLRSSLFPSQALRHIAVPTWWRDLRSFRRAHLKASLDLNSTLLLLFATFQADFEFSPSPRPSYPPALDSFFLLFLV